MQDIIQDMDIDLMETHAWQLFAERERILADEHLAGTKVNVRSGAAPASFPWPSLAAYLHFWQTGKGVIEEKGRRGLLIRVAGMAGSGTNSCRVAWEDGTSGITGVWPFPDYWRPWRDIIMQYPPREDGGTLEEVIECINKTGG